MSALLDRLDPDRTGVDPKTRLAWLRTARRVQARVTALTAQLTGEADHTKAAEETAGTPLASWLGMGETISRKEAAGALRQARKLAQHRLVGEAAVAGRLGTSQARAITTVLDNLASQLDEAQQAQAEQVMVDLAGHLDADQLSKAAGQVLKTVVPERAEESLETHLQRQAEAAYRQRSLRFFFEGASVRFDGSLPRPAAEAWIAQLDAHAEQARRTALERRDPLAETLMPEQRRADALIAQIHQPTSDGADGPSARVLVMLDYAKLTAGAAGAGVLPDGQELSAGELRRLCCQAEVIPVVLGGPSQVLDVGRAERLVTPQLRAALIARDKGCVFPGCDAPPSRCEAHHILPWYLGGLTWLHNLVLLCHSHHPVCEPARYGVRDQWQVRIAAADGLPEFIPPARLDPGQKPVRHARHQHPPGRSHTGPTRAA
nr:HNH endonuclease signature motif containing protein [Propionicimonas sp.]